jgi:hypothetical protein
LQLDGRTASLTIEKAGRDASGEPILAPVVTLQLN